MTDEDWDALWYYLGYAAGRARSQWPEDGEKHLKRTMELKDKLMALREELEKKS